MATKKKIPTSLARQYVKNYREQKLGKRLKIDDTHAVWFPRETILEVLNILNPAPEIGIVSGIRIYFGAYEEDVEPNINKKGKLNVILVQTRLDGEANKDILQDPTAQPSYPPVMPLGGEDEYDDGQICPPPNCDPQGLGNF